MKKLLQLLILVHRINQSNFTPNKSLNFLNWGKDVKIFDLKIKVNKKNKISSMDLNNNIETQFLLSFQKIIKKKFT